ncbi:MAG: hypothetical protein LBC92_00385 [Rickettsiales bacterium]|jgi:hypothetical protein|nr:hypothetical protein [Rickettsiales bacterium]
MEVETIDFDVINKNIEIFKSVFNSKNGAEVISLLLNDVICDLASCFDEKRTLFLQGKLNLILRIKNFIKESEDE